MRIALERLIHVQMGNVRVEEMMYVCHLMSVVGMAQIARGALLDNALIHNHCSRIKIFSVV